MDSKTEGEVNHKMSLYKRNENCTKDFLLAEDIGRTLQGVERRRSIVDTGSYGHLVTSKRHSLL